VRSSVNNQVHNVPITNKMNLKLYDELYSQFSHQYTLAGKRPSSRSYYYKTTKVQMWLVLSPSLLYNFYYAVTTTQITTFVTLYACNNITLKMVAIAAVSCWWEDWI